MLALCLLTLLVWLEAPGQASADIYEDLYQHIRRAETRARPVDLPSHGPPQLPAHHNTPQRTRPTRPDPQPLLGGLTKPAVQRRARSHQAAALATHPSEHTTPKADAPYRGLIRKAAKQYALPAALVHAVISVESGFNPAARSKAGAVGLMQLMPATATALGVHDRLNPADNIDGGCRYLRRLLNRYHNRLDKALAAYNAGPGLVLRFKGVPQQGPVRRYVHRVLQRFQRFSDQYANRDHPLLIWSLLASEPVSSQESL